MKICVINSIFKPETRGGAETAVANIVSGLKERGEDVFVICVGRNNSVDNVGGIKVYRVKPFNLFNFLDINSQPAWLRFFWHIIDVLNKVQAWRVYKILKTEKPDLVLTHNLKGLGYLTPLVIKFLKLKNIHTVHDMQLLHPSGLLGDGRTTSLAVAVYRWFCKKIFTSPQAVIFPSEYIKGVYERFGFFKNSKRIVLGNPIKVLDSKFPASPAGRQIPNSLPRRQAGRFQILFLGQVEAYKGVFDLIEAVGGLKGDFVLNIAGEGKALSEAKIMAQKALPDRPFGAQNGPRVRFWGRLGQIELEEKIWLASPKGGPMDLLVNPSQTPESFGMVVIEAFSHGVPALVSDKGALPELIKNGETGFVVKNNDWREKIEWCLNHRDELEKMRENCLKEAEKFKVENYLDKLLAIFKTI